MPSDWAPTLVPVVALLIALATFVTNIRKDTTKQLEEKLERAELDRDAYKRDLEQERQRSRDYLENYMSINEEIRRIRRNGGAV